MRALKAAGDANEAGIAQTEATLHDLQYSIRQTENSLALLLGDTPRTIERTTLDTQSVPTELAVGIPLQLLSRRSDIRQSEQATRTGILCDGRSSRRTLSVADVERFGGLDE